MDARPPLERARLGFDWVCRMVYVDDRVPWPANPWTTLQAGSGVALSRAYVVLAVWQQLGLDGCLVGPAGAEGARARSDSDGPGLPTDICPGAGVRRQDRQGHVPVRPGGGPSRLRRADGKGVLTLAQAKATRRRSRDSPAPTR